MEIKNITGSKCDFILAEWDYLDGIHGEERVSYVVIEAGNHTMLNGVKLQAGLTSVTSPKNVSLSGFSVAPVVFSQVSSDNSFYTVTTRQKSISSSQFNVALELQESTTASIQETVGYLAIELFTGNHDADLEVIKSSNSVTHSWSTFSLSNSFLAYSEIFSSELAISSKVLLPLSQWPRKSQSNKSEDR